MHMSLYETLLDERGFHDVKQAAFRALLEKVQTYVDLSLGLRSETRSESGFAGFPRLSWALPGNPWAREPQRSISSGNFMRRPMQS